LLDGQPAPGLPFLRQLQWAVTGDPTSDASIVQIVEAAAGDGLPAGHLWRLNAPYRGLAASTSQYRFLFWTNSRTAAVIQLLLGVPDKIPILIGNSG
jgi:hypothetical protein